MKPPTSIRKDKVETEVIGGRMDESPSQVISQIEEKSGYDYDRRREYSYYPQQQSHYAPNNRGHVYNQSSVTQYRQQQLPQTNVENGKLLSVLRRSKAGRHGQ